MAQGVGCGVDGLRCIKLCLNFNPELNQIRLGRCFKANETSLESITRIFMFRVTFSRTIWSL